MELLQSMKVFAKLAELGSFTKVADAMELGRPQVTLVIKELEATLGARLFHRTTRKVNLTAEGEKFYERVEEILGNIADATTMFGSQGATPRGRLRVDIPAAFAQLSFMDGLKRFSRSYPELDLILGVTDRTVDLVAEGVDCALRIGDLPDSSMVARKVGSAVMVTCASPEYLREHGEPASVGDLQAHRGVQFLSGFSNRPQPWRFSVDGEDKACHCRAAIRVNESKAYVQCGVAGFGIIQAPGVAVSEYLARGALVEVLAAHRPAPRPVSVLYPSRTFAAPRTQAFVEWLRKHFARIDQAWLG
ncbi:LysR family transcriptional regulator [Trinickia terrae]|uniref:LysR family transcriptional regulator n=1 Tax=Trinickia terrae TaxID=2571161 RepID=A0A4U1I5R9_9BURK|nr:LysR family transcriptional regulator [Trinickia terrae]TKC88699.1 LysR family transcriptional regulator [Trinickia terrae]